MLSIFPLRDVSHPSAPMTLIDHLHQRKYENGIQNWAKSSIMAEFIFWPYQKLIIAICYEYNCYCDQNGGLVILKILYIKKQH